MNFHIWHFFHETKHVTQQLKKYKDIEVLHLNLRILYIRVRFQVVGNQVNNVQ